MGHEVVLMPPAYTKPYVKRGKNDAVDAEAVCEAMTRPGMRLVPVKSMEQQATLALHKTRDLLIKQQTISCKNLDFTLRTMSDFAIHLTADMIGEGIRFCQ
jgi:transposase